MVLRKLLPLIILLCLVPGCKKAPKIYLVPIGNVPADEIVDLANHYHEKFGVPTEILPGIKPGDRDVDGMRQQLIAENLLQTLLENYSDIRTVKGDILIGVTSNDIYPKSQDWQFCFGWRNQDQLAAVVSTARMNLHYPGEPEGTSVRQRLRKVVTKDVGMLYYGKPASENPRSVLYNNIGGIQELDQVTEDF